MYEKGGEEGEKRPATCGSKKKKGKIKRGGEKRAALKSYGVGKKKKSGKKKKRKRKRKVGGGKKGGGRSVR